MAKGALAGLRIVECGRHVAAPYAAKLLADLGATVVKVEPPTGDASRRRGPFPHGQPDDKASGMFLYLNANKLGVVLDLEDERDRRRLAALIRWCDGFIHDLQPAQAERLQLTDGELQRLNPRLVSTAITPFGQTGPHRDYTAYELTTMHGGGWGWLSPGHLEDSSLPPLKTAGPQGDLQAGTSAAIATLAACFAARLNGAGGRSIDVSVQEVLADNKFNSGIQAYLITGRVPDRYGHPPFGPSGIALCRDGQVFILCVEEHQWRGLVETLGQPEWAGWGVFTTASERGANNDVLMPRIAELTRGYAREDLVAALQDRRVPCAPLYDIADVLGYQQFRDRGFFVEVDHPLAGHLTFPGAPYQFSETPWRVTRPAPRLGEHQDFVFNRLLDAKPAERADPRPVVGVRAHRAAATEEQPLLGGVRVLDLTHQWAGPVATKELRRLGAEVIRLEWTGRQTVTGSVSAHGIVTGYNSPSGHQHGKKSVLVNLKTREGVEVVRRLTACSDIKIENFAAGVMNRLGLGYHTLHSINPALVMVSTSGFGATGAHRDFVSYGRPQSYVSGLISLTGYPDGPPRELGIPYGDPNAGQLAALAALAGLHHARQTGQGQFIDLSQTEALATCAVEGLVEYQMSGCQPPRRGNRDRLMAPHNVYPCLGDDHWVTIACGNDDEWRALVAAIGDAELAHDPRFADAAGRKRHEDALERARPRFPIGTVGAYHGTNHGWLCAELIRRVDGRDFPQYLADEITGQLGMTDTYCGLPAARAPHVAKIHATEDSRSDPEFWVGRTFNRVDNLAAVVPAANVVASARDIARFYAALLGGGEIDGRRILRPDTVALATSTYVDHEVDLITKRHLRRGLGFNLGGLGGPDQRDGTRATARTFGHGGAGTSVCWADKDLDVAMAFLTNGFRDDTTNVPRARAISDAVREAAGES